MPIKNAPLSQGASGGLALIVCPTSARSASGTVTRADRCPSSPTHNRHLCLGGHVVRLTKAYLVEEVWIQQSFLQSFGGKVSQSFC